MAKKKVQAKVKSAPARAKSKPAPPRKAAKAPARPKAAKPAPKPSGPASARASGSGDLGAARARAGALELMHWVHSTTDALVHSIPADKALHQPAPTDNHLLWILGHLAITYSWFATLIDGRGIDFDPRYNQAFGFKSIPVPQAAQYPGLEEVKASYAAAYQRLVDAIASMSDADVYAPTASDAHGFASSRLDAVYKAIWHDGWHSGQISSLRRALGLPPIM